MSHNIHHFIAESKHIQEYKRSTYCDLFLLCCAVSEERNFITFIDWRCRWSLGFYLELCRVKIDMVTILYLVVIRSEKWPSFISTPTPLHAGMGCSDHHVLLVICFWCHCSYTGVHMWHFCSIPWLAVFPNASHFTENTRCIFMKEIVKSSARQD